MAECDNGHERISFDSPFSSLCPLCAVLRERNDRAEAIEAHLSPQIEDLEEEIESCQQQLDDVSREYAEYRKRNPEAK